MRQLVVSLLASLPPLCNVVSMLVFVLSLCGILSVQLWGWTGALHGRCRLTPYPLTLPHNFSVAQWNAEGYAFMSGTEFPSGDERLFDMWLGKNPHLHPHYDFQAYYHHRSALHHQMLARTQSPMPAPVLGQDQGRGNLLSPPPRPVQVRRCAAQANYPSLLERENATGGTGEGANWTSSSSNIPQLDCWWPIDRDDTRLCSLSQGGIGFGSYHCG